jgi:hypothetical protein
MPSEKAVERAQALWDSWWGPNVQEIKEGAAQIAEAIDAAVAEALREAPALTDYQRLAREQPGLLLQETEKLAHEMGAAEERMAILAWIGQHSFSAGHGDPPTATAATMRAWIESRGSVEEG